MANIRLFSKLITFFQFFQNIYFDIDYISNRYIYLRLQENVFLFGITLPVGFVSRPAIPVGECGFQTIPLNIIATRNLNERS